MECSKHQYEAIKKIEQSLDSKYVGGQKYQTGTLDKQKIYIFCIKCGDSKRIDIDLPIKPKD